MKVGDRVWTACGLGEIIAYDEENDLYTVNIEGRDRQQVMTEHEMVKIGDYNGTVGDS